MANKKLILLNLGWAALVAAAYFVDPSGPDTAVGASSPVDANSTSSSAAASLDGRVSRMFQEIADRSRTLDETTPDPIDAAEALAMAMADLDSALARQEALLAEVAQAVTPENAESILQVFLDTPRSEITDRVFVDFLESWGSVAGEEAAALIAEKSWSENPRERWNIEGLAGAVMKGWASADPDAAIAFTEGVRQNEEDWGRVLKSTEMHLGILEALQDTNLDRAIAYSQEFHEAIYQDSSIGGVEGIETLVTAIAEQRGMRGLEAWIDSMGSETAGLRDYQRAANTEMLRLMREDDPGQAAERVADTIDQDLVTPNDLVDAAPFFADTTTEQLEWIAEQSGQSVEVALRAKFSRLLNEDFNAAGDWLAQQSLGPTYDDTIAEFAREAAVYNPEAASAWAETITREDLKNDILNEIDAIAAQQADE